MSCIVTARAAVVGARPAVRTRLNTRSGAVVMSEGWTNRVTRYSLNTMMNDSISPALTPGPISGRTIRRNVCQRVAPRHSDASSNTSGRSFRATRIGVSISGNVPTAIARTSPQTDVVRWYVKLYVRTSEIPMTAPGTYRGSVIAEYSSRFPGNG